MTTTRFTNARFVDGSVGDIHTRGGLFAERAEPDEIIDLDDRLVTSALAEPHAHLDKAMLAERYPNPTGDLLSAIETMQAAWPDINVSDIAERARRTVKQMVASGTTFIRTHADTHTYAGLQSVRALTELRKDVEQVCTLQVVSLCYPVTGPDGPEVRRLLEGAVELGVDVIGGAPHLEDDPGCAMEFLLDVAADAGLPVDFHVDEVLDAKVDSLRQLADGTVSRGLQGRVTASHCVSHGLKAAADQRSIALSLAEAGISVVTLPRTNLFLQARDRDEAPPRGTLGIGAMVDAGVRVAGGADNVQDPFYAVGRCDPLETASLLISVCHRTADEAFEMVTDSARALGGLPPVTFEPGSPADFMATDAGGVRQAIADQPADRIVVHEGRVVARTSVDQWIAD